MYTYTVTPMYFYYKEMLSGPGDGKERLLTLSRTPQGFKTVVREGERVVHQFPRMMSDKLCHKLAQHHIAGLQAAKLIYKVKQGS